MERLVRCPSKLIPPRSDFFAQLTWRLYLLGFCEDRQMNPVIRLTGSIYTDTPNHDWFHDFFEDINSIALSGGNSNRIRPRPLIVKHIDETSLSGRHHPTLTLEEAHRLFTNNFRVKENIQSYIDNFIATEFAGDGVIGLHFRGTDKKWEAQPVEWPRCFQSVIKLAEDRPEVKKVFIASDETEFIDWFAKQANGSLSVVVHPDEERSREGKPVRLNLAGNHYRKGFEALVNCLLLSRCTAHPDSLFPIRLEQCF
jgi:hypothetical protein